MRTKIGGLIKVDYDFFPIHEEEKEPANKTINTICPNLDEEESLAVENEEVENGFVIISKDVFIPAASIDSTWSVLLSWMTLILDAKTTVSQIISNYTALTIKGRCKASQYINQKGSQINTYTLQQIAQLVEKHYEGRCKIMFTGSFLKGVEDYEQVKLAPPVQKLLRNGKLKGLEFVFLPFAFPGHIVLVAIDFKNKKIEYYDSQGIGINDSVRVKSFVNYDLPNDLEEIKNRCFPADKEAKIEEMAVKHQQDLHNCAIYLFDYIRRRLEGESIESIRKNGKSFLDIEEERSCFAEALDNGDFGKK